MLLLQGGADIVARAVDMLEVLDQPLLQGKHGVILQPVFLEADDLVDELETVLEAEGYAISVGGPGGAVTLLPLKASNRIVIFVTDPPDARSCRGVGPDS